MTSTNESLKDKDGRSPNLLSPPSWMQKILYGLELQKHVGNSQKRASG